MRALVIETFNSGTLVSTFFDYHELHKLYAWSFHSLVLLVSLLQALSFKRSSTPALACIYSQFNLGRVCHSRGVSI